MRTLCPAPRQPFFHNSYALHCPCRLSRCDLSRTARPARSFVPPGPCGGRTIIPKRQPRFLPGVASKKRRSRPQLDWSAVPKLAQGNPLRQQGLQRAKGTFGTATPRFHFGPKKEKGRARIRPCHAQGRNSVATIRNCRLKKSAQPSQPQRLNFLSRKTRLALLIFRRSAKCKDGHPERSAGFGRVLSRTDLAWS
jgi:hypothetical protein